MSNVRPPIDPMSDLSWARVERGLWSRLDGVAPDVEAPRSRRWLWIAIPSVAVAGAVAAAFAIVVDTPAQSTPAIATPGFEEAPTRIVSGASESTITVGDAHVTLAANSAVVMTRDKNTAMLERGAATFAIAPRAGRTFVVVAGDTTIRVIGTRFKVGRSEEHATVEVERGAVEVTFHGAVEMVTTGQTWTSQKPVPTDMTKSVEPEHDIVVEPAKPEPIVEPAKPAVTRAADPIVEPTKPTTKHATKSELAKPVDTDEAKYWRANALEVKNPSAAMTTYLEVARGTGTFAANSLYAAGRLAADRGEPRAKTLLEMYLQRFPRGSNTRDVQILLERLKGAQ